MSTWGKNWEDWVAMIFHDRVCARRTETNAKSYLEKTFFEYGDAYFDAFEFDKLSPAKAFMEVKNDVQLFVFTKKFCL